LGYKRSSSFHPLNGGYIANQENLSNAEILAKAVLLANNVIAQKDKLIADMKPKADYLGMAVEQVKGKY
jgi:hypothetical protein